MFFLIRSACCIGVVALFAASGDGSSLRTVVDDGGRNLARHLGEACIASRECQHVGMSLASAANRSTSLPPEAPHASGDTLQASDLAPAWSDPPMRHGSGHAGSAPSPPIAAARSI